MTNRLKDLDESELKAAAEAFGVDSEGNKEELLAALVEDGVTWAMYKKAFTKKEENMPEVKEKVEVDEANAITTEAMTGPSYEELVAALADATATIEKLKEDETAYVGGEYVKLQNDQLLIKMTRENPMFEIAGHRFTQEHPYALLDVDKAEEVLKEDGFRQARPSEIAEYYG